MRLLFLIQKASSRLAMVLTDSLKKCHYYSCYYGFWTLVWWIGNYCSRLSSWKKKAELKKREWLWIYFEKNYADIIRQYKDIPIQQSKPEEFRIWVYWAQGKDNMPELVRACYENLVCRAIDASVVLLTAENLEQYIDLPVPVKNSLNNGMIGYTALSDIIRHSLLSKYGGLWIDATVWVTGKVPVSTLKNLPFFSARASERQSYWVSYLLGSGVVGFPLFGFVREMMIACCEKEKCWPDYLFIDHLIAYAFYHFPAVREIMLSCPDNNPRRSDLWIRMNKVFDKEEYNIIIQDNWMFKLSYKSYLVPKVNGDLTFYGAMINGKLQSVEVISKDQRWS